MSPRRRFLLPLASLLFVTATAACGGTAEPASSSGSPGPAPASSSSSSSGAVAVANVGDVRGVRITDLRPEDSAQVVASRDAAKIARVVELLGLSGSLPEATQFPNCRPDAKVELFDATGKVAGTVDVYCGAATSILRVASGKAYAVTLSDLDALTKLEGDRLLVATWLFDISKVEIDKPLENRHRVLETRADIDAAVAALSPVETFDPNAPRTRCAADYAVTFTRSVGEGDPVVSRLFITCGGDPKASQPAWFQATTDLEGQVTVDALAIASLANAE